MTQTGLNADQHILNMKTMETRTNQNQIVIQTKPENEKEKLPVNIVLPLAAGAVAGMVFILGLFWGMEFLLGF